MTRAHTSTEQPEFGTQSKAEYAIEIRNLKRRIAELEASQAQRAPLLFNPFNGKPRHPSDVQSDPHGLLIIQPGAQLRATRITQEQG